MNALAHDLRKLASDKKRLALKDSELKRTEATLLKDLDTLLPEIGYQLTPLSTNGKGPVVDQFRITRGHIRLRGDLPPVPQRARAMKYKCPKCDRRFTHPLPMSRHVAATHGKKKATRKAARKGR